MKILVTGGAGFIGSTLVDRLLERGDQVSAVDNFSTRRREFLAGALKHSRFRLAEADLLTGEIPAGLMQGCDLVVHLSANADVRFGTERPARDFEQNTTVTFRLLEAMRKNGVKRIAFSSTGAVPGANVLVRGVQGGVREPDPGILRGVRVPGIYFPVCLDPWRALHSRARLRFLQEAARRSFAPARAGGRPPEKVVPVRAGLRVGDAMRARPRAGQGEHIQPWNQRALRGERFGQVDMRAPRRQAGAGIFRRKTRAGRETARSFFLTAPGSGLWDGALP